MFEDPIIAFSLLQMRNQVSLYLTIMLITFFFRIIFKASCGKHQAKHRVNDNPGLEKVEYGYNMGHKKAQAQH